MNNRLLALLSLCAKAGKLQSGQFLCSEALKKQKAKLVLCASDISYRTLKTLKDHAHYHHVPLFSVDFTQNELGHAIGQNARGCVAVMDPNFSDMLLKELGSSTKVANTTIN